MNSPSSECRSSRGEISWFRSYDQTRVHWFEIGEGPPLVVSATRGLPLGFWEPLFEKLSSSYRIIYVMQRALWGTDIPCDLEHVGVDAHARDLAAVIDGEVGDEFFALGYCSGVHPLVRSFDFTSRRPRRLCLMSGRYCVGEPLPGRQILRRVAKDPARRAHWIEMIVAFAPPFVAQLLDSELRKPGVLEAQLIAAESSRGHDGYRPLPAGSPVTFVEGEHDEPLVKESTRAYLAEFGQPAWRIVEMPGAGHFYIHDALEATEVVVRAALQRAE